MLQHPNQPVSVLYGFHAETRATVPYKVAWNGKTYRVRELGFAHTYRHGRAVMHVFEVNVGPLDMRLELNGETLHWTLTAVSDGEVD